MKKEDLLFFSNGPGEVSTWVLPVLEEVTSRNELRDRYRALLIVHPCQFSSGTEHLVARGFEGIEAVIRPSEYLKLLTTGMGRKKYGFKREGIMFSLGGDLMHPVLLRCRIRGKHRLYAYTNNTGWERFYEKIFVRSGYVKEKLRRHGCPEEKLIVAGDLVYNSMKSLRRRDEARRALNLKSNDLMVVFLPGSRDFEVKYMLPVFLKVIDDMTERRKDVRAFVLKSPFVGSELLEKALSLGGKIREMESLTGALSDPVEGKGSFIELRNGKRVYVLEGGLEFWGEGVDFSVTLPGTNTVQLAYRGIPSLVVSPMNKPEVIPIEGVFGLLKWIPLVGKPVLKKAVLRYIQKFRFAALPNIYENEEVFPELFGVIQTDDITRKIIEILESGMAQSIRHKLARFKPDKSPVSIIMNEVWGKNREVCS